MSIVQPRTARLYLALGHSFARPEVLEEALTHSSAGQAHAGAGAPGPGPSGANGSAGTLTGRDYERMEFLGDRVLNLVVAQLLLQRYPDEKVGALARRHAALVREEALAEVARRVGLGEFIRLSAGEDQTGGRTNPSLLADCCEAVIAALFIDGGMPVAERFITKFWAPMVAQTPRPPKDPKTALQEWAQGRGLPLPVYSTVTQSGPDHDPNFTVRVSVRGLPAATATGRSKRLAEQIAAQFLLGIISGQHTQASAGNATHGQAQKPRLN